MSGSVKDADMHVYLLLYMHFDQYIIKDTINLEVIKYYYDLFYSVLKRNQ